MNSPQLQANQRYTTAADYAAWNDGQRYELFHGGVHAMSPAPNPRHQGTSRNLTLEVGSFLKPKARCQIFYAPIDVYLSDDTVVQPDIIVVCDPKKNRQNRGRRRAGFGGENPVAVHVENRLAREISIIRRGRSA